MARCTFNTARTRCTFVLAAVVSMLAALVTGCAGHSSAAEIVVYDGHDHRLTKLWADAFTRQTGIRVVLRTGGEFDLADEIAAEGDRTPADVYLAGNSPALAKLDRAGRFSPLDPATLAHTPAWMRPSTGRWTAVAARSAILAHDPVRLPADQLPGSLLDLAQPQWRGRWSVDPRGVDFQTLVAGVLALDGPDVTRAWLRGVKDTVLVPPGAVGPLESVGAGHVDSAVVFDTEWYRDRIAPARVGGTSVPSYFGARDPGALLSLSGAAVLKSSKNSASAQRFVEFVTDIGGQSLLSGRAAMEYPVLAGVPADPALPPLDSLRPPHPDLSRLDPDQAKALVREAGLLPPSGN
ncbi:MAG: extracellular solute-binding protein [Nocardia sp.]|nr:extracellular solute-binding protein [Nocardia sp.]